MFNKYRFREKSKFRKVNFVNDIFCLLKLPFVNNFNIINIVNVRYIFLIINSATR